MTDLLLSHVRIFGLLYFLMKKGKMEINDCLVHLEVPSENSWLVYGFILKDDEKYDLVVNLKDKKVMVEDIGFFSYNEEERGFAFAPVPGELIKTE